LHPELKEEFLEEAAGRRAVKIQPGILGREIVLCLPFLMAPSKDRVLKIQEAMCGGFMVYSW